MSVYTKPPTQTVEELARITYGGLLFQVACTAAVLWDHVSTLDLEVELIWKKKWSLAQGLYFINRYVGDLMFIYATALMLWIPNEPFKLLYAVSYSLSLGQSSPSHFLDFTRCISFGKVQTWLSILSLGAMQGIMVHRIVSMYQQKRAILAVLLAAFLLELVAAIVIGVYSTRENGIPLFYDTVNGTLRTCIPSIPPWFWGLWMLLMVFDFLIFVLAIWEGLQFRKESQARLRSRQMNEIMVGTRYKERSLLRILLRDSIIFPFIGLLMCISNALAWHVLPLGVLQYTMNISAAGYPILGCRLILNLRESYYRPFADELRHETQSGPDATPPDLELHTPQDDEVYEMPEVTMYEAKRT
ncbi:hypothetical protein DFP72DRAFT_1081796 [Ephemerocybe angulata]|uniref:DUF6533 domain-containing protein n=1 Tax=Ephemerocybe angulata TaxID=980116 RepID=A0A8H6HAD8_9AGAR|nr:hypothetical protein DFP72DRAFT_1081796 [Tulosesus angulatus]